MKTVVMRWLLVWKIIGNNLPPKENEMISDVLSDAVQEFDRYLEESDIYKEEDWNPESWKLLMDCRKIMIETRVMLDSPPTSPDYK